MSILNTLSEEQKRTYITTYDTLIIKLTEDIAGWKLSMNKAIAKHTKNDPLAYHSAGVPVLIRLSLLDIVILFKSILSAKAYTEQNLFARLICAQLYEFFENVPDIFGKKYRDKLAHFPNDKVLLKELNVLMRKFNFHRNKFSAAFKYVRNNVSSHKDIDSMKQMELIEKIDFNSIVHAFIEVIKWFAEYSEFELKQIEIAEKYNPRLVELLEARNKNK